MPSFEYKVVPAPAKGLKAKGLKTPEARFSHALQELMNTLSQDGWEYQRAETLPSTERSGLASSTTEWRNVLVFRRPRQDAAEAFAPELLPPPSAEDDKVQPTPAAPKPADPKPAPQDDVAEPSESPKPDRPRQSDWDDDVDSDNAVDSTADRTGLGSSAANLAAFRKAAKSKD